MSLLEVNHVSVSFGGLMALRDITFTVDEGSIFACIGPNGAGKSTIYNCINGFVNPDGGEIRLSGKELTRLAPHKIAELGITRTFQNLELFPFKSALDNILMGLHLKINTGFLSSSLYFGKNRQAEDAAEDEVLEVMNFLGIRFCKDLPAGSLPFVTRRMVEVARALVSKPKLMLLDEPSSGMNEQETRELGKIIKAIREDYGTTIILVEHDMSLVMEISDKIMVLNFGEKLAEGTSKEIKSNKEVQEAFLGKDYHAAAG
ncbi:ABC transporter ATP-binding protein [Thermodesulfobacteriota bacterium]